MTDNLAALRREAGRLLGRYWTLEDIKALPIIKPDAGCKVWIHSASAVDVHGDYWTAYFRRGTGEWGCYVRRHADTMRELNESREALGLPPYSTDSAAGDQT